MEVKFEEYHYKKYCEAVEQENWERAEHHDKRYTDIVTSKELSRLQKFLVGLVVFLCLSPFIQFWLFR